MKVMSFDGGGVRGIFSAKLVERLCEKYPDFYKYADLYVGTSTGSIIAAAFAYGLSPSQIVAFFEKYSSQIFYTSFFRKVETLDSFVESKYENDAKRKAFEAVFGNKKLSDLKKQVFFVSFQLDNYGKSKYGNKKVRQWWPRFFDNTPGSPDLNMTIVDALMATTAAPSYFPMFKGYIDGGIRYNNPSMLGITEAIKRGAKFEDITLMSFGTGVNPDFLAEKNADWGLAQWAPYLLKIFLSDDYAVDIQAQSMLGDRYFRFQKEYKETIELDDYKQMDKLLKYAKDYNLEFAYPFFDQYYKFKMKSVA